MSNVLVDDVKLELIGNAIREKTSTTDLLLLDDMPNAILNISGSDDFIISNVEQDGTSLILTADKKESVLDKYHKVSFKQPIYEDSGWFVLIKYDSDIVINSREKLMEALFECQNGVGDGTIDEYPSFKSDGGNFAKAFGKIYYTSYGYCGAFSMCAEAKTRLKLQFFTTNGDYGFYEYELYKNDYGSSNYNGWVIVSDTIVYI